MAKLTGPLLSQKASGSIAGNITFSERRSGSQARFQRKQKDVLTADRTVQRNKFLNAVECWNNKFYGVAAYGVSSYGMDLASFEAQAKKYHMTGYNFFIKNFLLSG